MFGSAMNNVPHAEEHPKGASRSTHDGATAILFIDPVNSRIGYFALTRYQGCGCPGTLLRKV
jgi:hypothetical protein